MLKQLPKLVRRKEDGFSEYGCSACGWLYPNPRFTPHGIGSREDLKVAFLLHKCDENPAQKMKTLQSFRERALRASRRRMRLEPNTSLLVVP